MIDRRELAKEVVELLTAAADGAKSLIDASDRLVLHVEIARFICRSSCISSSRKCFFLNPLLQ